MIKVNSLKYFLIVLVFCNLNVFSQKAKEKLNIIEKSDFYEKALANLKLYEEKLNLGIEKSDLEIIKKTLPYLKLDENKKKHLLLLANEKINLRKEMLIIELLSSSSVEEKRFLSLAGYFASGASLLYFIIRMQEGTYTSSAGIFASLLSFGVSIAYLTTMEKRCILQNEYKSLYKNAIEIRNLIKKS